MNSTTLPLIRCGILFMAGILSLNWFYDVPLAVLCVVTILYFVMILFSDAGDRRFVVVQTFLLYAGILLFGNYCAYKRLTDVEENRLPNGHYNVSGILVGKPNLKNNHYRVILNTKQVRQQEIHFQLHNAKILLYIPKTDNDFAGVKPGDEVSLDGQILEFPTSSNPAAFNMKEYYARKGILQQMFVETGCWNHIASAQNNSLSGIVRNTQAYALSKLDRIITETDERAVVKALLLGNRDDMPEHISESFSQTGAVHVLAVSGLHVGAVLYVFVLFFRKLPQKKWIQAVFKPLILCCVAIFYVLLTGSSPSVTRAAIMFLLILIGKEWFRDVNSLNILFVSAIWILLYDPFLLYNLSFQFSYLSLGSILLFYPFFRVLYIPLNRLSKSVWGLVAVSMSAQVLIFPISIYYFNQFPIYFIISSLIAIPLAVFLVYGGFVMLIIDYLFGSIHPTIQWAYNESVSFLIYCIESIQEWPYAVLEKIWFDDIQIFLLYLSIFLLFLYLQNSIRIYYYLFLIFVFSVIFIQQKNYVRSVNQLRICVYDVSKGFLADFFVGKTAFALVSNNIDSKREKMIASKNRIKNGIHHVVNLSEVSIKNKKFSFDPDDGVRLGQAKVIVLSDQYPVLSEKETYDIVIITKGARLFSDWERQSGNIRKIILCNNIKDFQRKQWVACLEEYRIPYVDVKTHGYSEINIPPK